MHQSQSSRILGLLWFLGKIYTCWQFFHNPQLFTPWNKTFTKGKHIKTSRKWKNVDIHRQYLCNLFISSFNTLKWCWCPHLFPVIFCLQWLLVLTTLKINLMGQTNSVKKMRRLILKTYALRLCCYYVLLYCYCIFYFYLALISVSEKWSCGCLRNHAATLSGWFMSRLFQVGHGYVIFLVQGF